LLDGKITKELIAVKSLVYGYRGDIMKLKKYKILLKELLFNFLFLIILLFLTFAIIHSFFTDQFEVWLLFLLPISVAGTILFFYTIFKNFVQCLVVTDKGITTKNLFGKINDLTWKEIHSATIVNFSDTKVAMQSKKIYHFDRFSAMHIPKLIKHDKWIVFNEDNADIYREKILSYIVPFVKNQPIKIQYCQKLVNFISKYIEINEEIIDSPSAMINC